MIKTDQPRSKGVARATQEGGLHTATNGVHPGNVDSVREPANMRSTSSVLEYSQKLIKEEKTVFVPTAAYHKALELLYTSPILIIRGPPASGKTAIGQALLRHFADKGHTPLVLPSCQEWRNHVGGDRKQIVLLDCPLGEVRVERSRYLEWAMTLSCLGQFTMVNRNCLVVITLHTHVIAELDSMTEQGKSYFDDMPELDLSDVTLTHQEKEEMLRKHLARSKLKLDAKELNDAITRETVGFAFPWSCKEYARKYSRDGYEILNGDSNVFQSPSFAYVNFFRRVLQDPENWKDLVPLFVLAMNGSGTLIGQKEQIKTKLDILGIDPKEVDLEGLIHRASILRGSFLNANNKSFMSRALCDAFCVALFETGSVELLVKACNLRFFVQHLHIQPQAFNTVLIINRTSKHYATFLIRISQEIINGNVVQMSQHPALQDDQFLADFDEFLRQRNTLKVLLSARDPRHDMPLLYWSAWCKSGHLTQWCLNRSVSQVDGRILRRTFLACCLFGEKVTSARVTDMLEMLCEDSNVLDDPVSDVTLPAPPEEARIDQEIVGSCRQVLSGSKLLFCGHGGNRGNPILSSSSLDDPSSAEPCPRRLGSFSTTDSLTLQKVRLLSLILEESSISTLPSSGNLVPFSATSSLRSRCGTMSTVSEFHTLGVVNESEQASLISGFSGNTSADSFLWLQNPSRRTSVSTMVSTQTNVLPEVYVTHQHSGIPLPPSIVKVFVETQEGKLVLQPKCARWYTLFRLLSMCGVDEVNRDGYTLLHTAAFNGEMNVVQFLVESGADMTRQTRHGNTPLTKALDRNQVSTASYLLHEGRKVSTTPVDHMTSASTNTTADTARSIADSITTTATTTDTTTSTIRARSADTTSTALGHAGHILCRMLGTRFLHDILVKAVLKRRSEVLLLLLSHGAYPHSKGGEGKSLLDAARSVDNNDEVIKVLTEHVNRRAGGEVIYATPTTKRSK